MLLDKSRSAVRTIGRIILRSRRREKGIAETGRPAVPMPLRCARLPKLFRSAGRGLLASPSPRERREGFVRSPRCGRPPSYRRPAKFGGVLELSRAQRNSESSADSTIRTAKEWLVCRTFAGNADRDRSRGGRRATSHPGPYSLALKACDITNTWK